LASSLNGKSIGAVELLHLNDRLEWSGFPKYDLSGTAPRLPKRRTDELTFVSVTVHVTRPARQRAPANGIEGRNEGDAVRVPFQGCQVYSQREKMAQTCRKQFRRAPVVIVWPPRAPTIRSAKPIAIDIACGADRKTPAIVIFPKWPTSSNPLRPG
jgi:hypothetical protein